MHALLKMLVTWELIIAGSVMLHFIRHVMILSQNLADKYLLFYHTVLAY